MAQVLHYQFRSHSRRPNGRSMVRMSSAWGFSLIELLLAIVVLCIVSTVAYANYEKFVRNAKIAGAKSDISGIYLALETFRGTEGYLPESLEELGRDSLEDPWGNAYVFTNFEYIKGNGKKRKNRNLVPINSDYDIYSLGEDGESSPPLTAKKSLDDVILANNGQFIGLAEDY